MKKGFTLIELMIVVAIIAIIAAIAIPSLLRSRMATNQTAAAAACKAIIEAQEIYHRSDYDQDGKLEYCFYLGGNGQLDSLLSNTVEGDLALVDRALADAEATGTGTGLGTSTPKAGYVFAILSHQGTNAPGGTKIWHTVATPVGNGLATNLTLAHGATAAPAQYDNTGRDWFLISSAGTIYQKDLAGPGGGGTQNSFMTSFDPDTLWVPSE